MNSKKTLQEQLDKAIKDYERAKKVESLTKTHSMINRQIRDKNKVIIEKLKKGVIMTEAEQDEIYQLGKRQEEVYRELADIILGNTECC